MSDQVLYSNSEAETKKLAKRLAEVSRDGDIILLTGGLGAGKTHFVKGLADGLDIQLRITSPTFVFLREYSGRITLFHMDLYRGSQTSYLETGAPDFAGAEGLTVIEWGERIEDLMKASLLSYLKIFIEFGEGEDERILRIEPHGPRAQELSNEWIRGVG